MHPIVLPRLEYSSFPSPGCSVCPEVISRYNYCPCCVFCCVLFFSRFVSNSIIQEDNLRWKLLFCSHRQYLVPPLQSFSRAFSDQRTMSTSVMTSANLPSQADASLLMLPMYAHVLRRRRMQILISTLQPPVEAACFLRQTAPDHFFGIKSP